jgi:predicted protein tyrosine phosphatase
VGRQSYIDTFDDSPIPMIHVCSLARLHQTVAATGARHVVSLMKDIEIIGRPDCISSENHLLLGMDDITAPLEGYIAPADEHVASLLTFVRRWDRAAPLVLHCYAGISRSTAAAFVTACALNPTRDERRIARSLRLASPTATPNIRIVALGDKALARSGRMTAAIEAIGQGEMAAEGTPFRLDLE